jgi:hypothetical protein
VNTENVGKDGIFNSKREIIIIIYKKKGKSKNENQPNQTLCSYP